jgi:predicted HTH transcriptional regulator
MRRILRRHELRELIRDGESSTLEFKRKFTSAPKIAKEVSAFANTKGGILLLGVDDNGSIVGVQSEKEQVDLLTKATQFYLDPPVDCFIDVIEVDWKDVIVVTVPESIDKPHLVINDPDSMDNEKRAYIRHDDESVLASKEMLRLLSGTNLYSAPMTLHIGEREQRLFSYLETAGRITVIEFADLVNISKRRSSQILVRLVRANVLMIHTDRQSDYFTLV